MPEGMDYYDYSPLVASKVQEDTFPSLGIGEGPSEINGPLLEMIDAYWSAPEEERQGIEIPGFEQVFGPGMEKVLIGTLGEAGYRHGDKPGFSDWLEQRKMEVAKGYEDPMHKNRVALLTVQSGASGQDRLLAERLDPGGGAPPAVAPTPAPTPGPATNPYPPGTEEYLIWEAEQKQGGLRGLGGLNP